MAPENRAARIVRSWPGPGTADTRYETDDGRVWESPPSHATVDGTAGTGVTFGSVRNGFIVEDRPRCLSKCSTTTARTCRR